MRMMVSIHSFFRWLIQGWRWGKVGILRWESFKYIYWLRRRADWIGVRGSLLRS